MFVIFSPLRSTKSTQTSLSLVRGTIHFNLGFGHRLPGGQSTKTQFPASIARSPSVVQKAAGWVRNANPSHENPSHAVARGENEKRPVHADAYHGALESLRGFKATS